MGWRRLGIREEVNPSEFGLEENECHLSASFPQRTLSLPPMLIIGSNVETCVYLRRIRWFCLARDAQLAEEAFR